MLSEVHISSDLPSIVFFNSYFGFSKKLPVKKVQIQEVAEFLFS